MRRSQQVRKEVTMIRSFYPFIRAEKEVFCFCPLSLSAGSLSNQKKLMLMLGVVISKQQASLSLLSSFLFFSFFFFQREKETDDTKN